ncbi:MAG: DUF3108 domain-containing protein [Longimicrobiales bacterium]|nr:DUF3108 domain-containing protein [Longimicrobiales bacterium]
MTVATLRAGSPIVALGVLALLGAPGGVDAQNGSGIRIPASLPAIEPPDVPFGPGEQLIYQVKLGALDVGEGFLQVLPIDTVRGRSVYPVELGLNGSTAFGMMKVRDIFRSWIDVETLASLRFHKDQHELTYKSRKHYDIFPERQEWTRTDAEQTGTTLTDLPLDEIAFIYFIRTLDLEVGEEYTFNHYFKEDGNPVVLRVLRRERKKVPAGTFDTIVVQPIIQTDGLFSEGGKAEVYLTDDAERHIVYLSSEVPIVGSLTLLLKEIRDPSIAGSVSRAESGGDGGNTR